MCVHELCLLGARTKTIQRLTGSRDLLIRDVYHEIFKKSPKRGPTGSSPNWYLRNAVRVMDSTLAANIISRTFASSAAAEPGEQLARTYIDAYHEYEKVVKQIRPRLRQVGMDFERFAHLSFLMHERAHFGFRACSKCRCNFLSGVSEDFVHDVQCPWCYLTDVTTCGQCRAYVPLDFSGDCIPRRFGMCLHCASKHARSATTRAEAVAKLAAMSEEGERRRSADSLGPHSSPPASGLLLTRRRARRRKSVPVASAASASLDSDPCLSATNLAGASIAAVDA